MSRGRCVCDFTTATHLIIICTPNNVDYPWNYYVPLTLIYTLHERIGDDVSVTSQQQLQQQQLQQQPQQPQQQPLQAHSHKSKPTMALSKRG